MWRVSSKTGARAHGVGKDGDNFPLGLVEPYFSDTRSCRFAIFRASFINNTAECAITETGTAAPNADGVYAVVSPYRHQRHLQQRVRLTPLRHFHHCLFVGVGGTWRRPVQSHRPCDLTPASCTGGKFLVGRIEGRRFDGLGHMVRTTLVLGAC